MLNYEDLELSIATHSEHSAEILRNVKVILTTLEGTVPYDRDFGISVEIIDAPINEVKSLYTVECVRKVRMYEPRAAIASVDFSYGLNGEVYPKVVLSIETN